MIRSVYLAFIFAAGSCCTLAHAQVDDDELVRLPGQGEVRSDDLRARTNADRLKPGAGLFITFDSNEDGRISPFEVDVGIPIAFRVADRNSDGYLTALEQQNWAAGLPTRDDSLANPFRFDPNLDRRVDLEEFTTVIVNLGTDYADETSGDIIVSDLKAPEIGRDRRRGADGEGSQNRPRGDRAPGQRNQSSAN